MEISITRNPNLTKYQRERNLENEVQKNFKEKYKVSWWTGLSPKECPGFDKERNCLNALPLLNLDLCSREDILAYFNNSWTLTELLFQGLKTEQTFVRPPYHGLRHPMMFYYGHTAVIFVNKMRIAGLIKEPINLYLEKVLETGVDEMSWDDMSKNEMAWPKLIEVHGYRKIVYDLIVNLIKTHPEFDFKNSKRSVLADTPFWAIWMGMEHEKIHFETSSVLIRELPIDLVETPEYFAPIHPSKNDNAELKNTWIMANATKVHIGKKFNEPSFGWDNEYGDRDVEIKDYYFSKYQITNREYYDFVASGAYVVDKYWAAEGLYWRKFRNTKRPCFWSAVGPEGAHEYELRTIFESIPMPWNWPAEVNYHEAIAYANWKKELDQSNYHYRLMTEGEFIALRTKDADPVLQKKPMKDYKNLLQEIKVNFNFLWSSPKNVDENLYGNTWHWMMDQFNPLNDFKTNYLYDDFSTPCFDGKHQMILGGSFISCGNEASHFSRFHFRPHFYQHSGFRLAYTADGSIDNAATKLSVSTEYVHPRRLNVLDQMNKTDWWKTVNQPLQMTEEEKKTLLEITNKEVLIYERDEAKMSPMGLAHDPKINGLKENFTIPHIQTKNFPAKPENYESLLKMIFGELAPLGQHPGHPGFAAYVAGSGNPISNLAQMVAMTLNQYTGHYMMAPGLVSIEEEAVKWFIDLMGLDISSANGFFTTGSSLASLSAIMMARNSLIKNTNDYSKVTGYISSEGHHSLYKNWVMLGFNKSNLRAVKTINHKMDSSELKKLIANDLKNGMTPMLVISTAGTTKTGTVDPINEIANISDEFKIWHHVDGAYGASFMLTEAGKKILKGIERAQSISLDLHKAFSLSYGTGMLLVSDVTKMIFDYSADESYMPPKPTDHFDYADISPELSRDSRGLRIWLPIKTLGIGPFILNLEEKLALAQYAYEKLNQFKNIKIVSKPELTIQTFKHVKGNQATKELLAQINNEGILFLSGAQIEGEEVIRLCLLSHQLHFERLENGLNSIEKLSNQI